MNSIKNLHKRLLMCGFQIKVVLSNYKPQLLGKEKPAHDSKEFQHQPAASLLMKKIRRRNYHRITILNKTQKGKQQGRT